MFSIPILHLLTAFTTLTLHFPSIKALPSPQDNYPGPAGAPNAGLIGGLDAFFQGLIVGADSAFAKDLMKKLGGSGPTCCDGALPGCKVNAGTNSYGHKWMACYHEGSEMIHDFDVAAMKCIINLHYQQTSACIDIAGSTCGANYGGGLMRGQVGYIGGNQAADRVSDQDSKTLQAAADSMLGVKIDYAAGHNAAVDLNTVSDVKGLLVFEMMFDGHQGSDC